MLSLDWREEEYNAKCILGHSQVSRTCGQRGFNRVGPVTRATCSHASALPSTLKLMGETQKKGYYAAGSCIWSLG